MDHRGLSPVIHNIQFAILKGDFRAGVNGRVSLHDNWESARVRVRCGGGRLEGEGRAGVRPKLEHLMGLGSAAVLWDPAFVLEVEDFEKGLIRLF